jgi:hypothetical protein
MCQRDAGEIKTGRFDIALPVRSPVAIMHIRYAFYYYFKFRAISMSVFLDTIYLHLTCLTGAANSYPADYGYHARRRDTCGLPAARAGGLRIHRENRPANTEGTG